MRKVYGCLAVMNDDYLTTPEVIKGLSHNGECYNSQEEYLATYIDRIFKKHLMDAYLVALEKCKDYHAAQLGRISPMEPNDAKNNNWVCIDDDEYISFIKDGNGGYIGLLRNFSSKKCYRTYIQDKSLCEMITTKSLVNDKLVAYIKTHGVMRGF